MTVPPPFLQFYVEAHSILRILKKLPRSLSSKMRLNGLKMSNFGGKWRFSMGAAVQPPFFSVLKVGTFNSENLKKVEF